MSQELKRPDAKRDEDGDCSVCGLPWPDERETLEPHICPPGFLRALPPASQGVPEEPLFQEADIMHEGHRRARRVCDKADYDALLAYATRPHALPAGWILAPKNPTHSMLMAGAKAVDERLGSVMLDLAYKAMLTAHTGEKDERK